MRCRFGANRHAISILRNTNVWFCEQHNFWRYGLPGTNHRHRCRADFTAGRRDSIRSCWDSTKIVQLQAQLPEVWFVPAGLLVSRTLILVAGLFVTISIMGLLLDATLTPAEPVSVEFDAGSLGGGLAGPD